MKLLTIFLLATFSLSLSAQRDSGIAIRVVKSAPVITTQPVIENKVFQMVEQMPEYPGGDEAMVKFIHEHLKYPDMERENNIQGRVVVGFIVEEDGSLSNIAIKKGVSKNINAEALRVVGLLPKFMPGKQNGQLVKVQFVLPIMFNLVSDEPVRKK